jgi:hypothetical protein
MIKRVQLNNSYDYDIISNPTEGLTGVWVYATPCWPVRRKMAKIDTISNTVLFFGEVSARDIKATGEVAAKFGYYIRPSKFAGKVAAGLKAGHSCFKL